MAHLHELPHYRIGHQIRFTDEDVAAIRQMNRHVAPEPHPSGLTPRSLAHLRAHPNG